MKEIEGRIIDFLSSRGWENLQPADLAKSVSIEAAELLEIFQWINPTVEELKDNSALINKIGDEIADVMTYCVELAILVGLDPKQIILSKLGKSELKYPADVMKKSLQTDRVPNTTYYQIRDEYRKHEKGRDDG